MDPKAPTQRRTETLLGHLRASHGADSRAFEQRENGSIPRGLGRALTAGEGAQRNASPFLHGAFEPTREELEGAECLAVFGKLPSDLDGIYCHNGPNSYFDPPEDQPYHWFDGDGMLHSIDVRNGRATYSNKYIQTKRLQMDKARGLSVYNMGALEVGDMSTTLDDRVMDPSNGRLYGRLQTNVIYHGRRMLALEEVDLPYHISTVRLETVGQYNFAGKLDHPMTAHPKICPTTGELFIFGHEVNPDPNKAFLSYSLISKDGDLKSTVRIPVRGSRFMHDMALTEKYVIFIDLPAIFDWELKEGTPWAFDNSLPLRFGVFPRYSTNPSDVKWFDCAPGMIFHTTNAYEDGGKVIIHACRGERYTMAFNRTDDPQNWLFPYEWTLDLKSGRCVREQRLCPVRCDFPLVAPHIVGKKQRYSYYSTYRPRDGDNVPQYDGLVKFDHVTGRVIEIRLDSHLACSDFAFVPKYHAKLEDDGYLMTYVYNGKNRTSELWIFDARTVESGNGAKGLVCRLGLPHRVPIGFHGNWISRKELDSAINC